MASIPTVIPLPNNLLRPVQIRHIISTTLFPLYRLRRRQRSTSQISCTSAPSNPHHQKQQTRSPSPTLFPGGYKRPEIKVPTLVLKVKPEEVLGSVDRRAEIDVALSKGVVGIVVLENDSGGGGRVYEAAGVLKTVVGDRAYVVLEDRVDVAAAVGASGVVLSDRGLPAIVARNVMSKSTSESVLLPLVARRLQSAGDAVSASSFEGADFLIISTDMENYTKVLDDFVITLDIKIPFFFAVDDITRGDSLYSTATKLLQSGASGMILSLDDLNWLSDGILKKLFQNASKLNGRIQSKGLNSDELSNIDTARKEHVSKQMVAGFTKLSEREIQFIERERNILLEAVTTIRRAAPLMVEVSLLVDAISRLDQPFLMAIVGEFNSGKSSVINALLGRSYLKDGVVPTTNEITLLCYSESDSVEQERCEKHPDGQFICYLSAPILKEMNLVDTPGTNVILQRQQRLTEEYIPRADIVLFVLSSDRPLTESEVNFLMYVRQWKKRVVFVLNKSDLYRNASELEEAMEFIKVNVTKMLNTEHMELYPVSARSALEAKLSISSYIEDLSRSALTNNHLWMSSGFSELENFLFSFLDGSTETGMERMRLKCGTPIAIADRLLDSCERLTKQDYESACRDLSSINEMIKSVHDYAMKMENESLFWKKQTLSLIDGAKTRAVNFIESILQLSNIDLLFSYAFKREKSRSPSATTTIKNDIISPALSDTQKLLGEYVQWLENSTAQESQQFFKDFDEKWSWFINPRDEVQSDTNALLINHDKISIEVARNFSTSAAARLFDQEISEVVLSTYGGLGVSSLSASLLTSVLPTTVEDLLALALCSAGGFYVISNFPGRRKNAIAKVTKVADALAKEIEDAMKEDLSVAMEKLKTFVELTGKPYQQAAQNKIDRLSEIQSELDSTRQKLHGLKTEIQNFHVL